MESKKTCKNCRHYIHYFIKDNARYRDTGSGFCRHHYMNPRERRMFPNIEDCAYWEPEELQPKERRETIKTVLRSMRKQLSEIAEILKDDEMNPPSVNR